MLRVGTACWPAPVTRCTNPSCWLGGELPADAGTMLAPPSRGTRRRCGKHLHHCSRGKGRFHLSCFHMLSHHKPCLPTPRTHMAHLWRLLGCMPKVWSLLGQQSQRQHGWPAGGVHRSHCSSLQTQLGRHAHSLCLKLQTIHFPQCRDNFARHEVLHAWHVTNRTTSPATKVEC